ncbi:MAG: alpha,alpha-trehalase [Phototrophicales bacterium]|nr:MAG: alpha,alpha-trehalase [Phototrophicales bacterium]
MSREGVLNYIENYWAKITRHHPTDEGTLIGLPHPYVVPRESGMFQEMYYWDSFFIAVGLVGTEREGLALGMIENMAALFERFGIIPNASRFYFTSRSQPPIFTAYMRMLVERAGKDQDSAWLARMTDIAIREHETVWLGTEQPHHRMVHRGLSRYFDINYLDMLASCESGWDHSTRCEDRWLAHLPVDLNSLLYLRETDIAWALDRLGQPEAAADWRERAVARRETMLDLMWDDEAGFFFDYDYVNQERSPHVSLAGFYPLWAGLATEAQAASVVRYWLPELLRPGGLVTTLTAQEGRQWAYPNGWAPLQWIAAAGLERYGYHTEARRVMVTWCATVEAVFAQTGTIYEKYNVVEPTGEASVGLYGQLTGFGWTNGVYLDFVRRLDAPPISGR